MYKLFRKYFISVIIYMILTDMIYAQSASSFENISIKDGLSHNEIWAFEQDKYGYMWIATADGLNRYDGYDFMIFKNDPEDTTSLPSNLVTHVLEDSDGLLWVSTSGGLSLFDRRTETFKNYKYSDASRENANFVSYLFEDSKGILWTSTGDGIRSFDSDKRNFIEYEVLRQDNSVARFNASGYTVLETRSGELFGASVAYGFLKFDYENKLFIQLKFDNEFQKQLRGTEVFTMIEDKNGNIYYASRKGLFSIDPKNLKVKVIRNPLNGKEFNIPSALFEAKNGELWIGTFWDGLILYDPSKKEAKKLPAQEKGFYDFHTDRTGLLWMGTFQGVVKYNFNKAPFELYTFRSAESEDKPIVLALTQSRKYPHRIWLGTQKGLYYLDKKENTINSFKVFPPVNKSTEVIEIEDIIESRDEKLYMGTTQNGLYEYDLTSGKLAEYQHVQYSRSSLGVDDVNVLFEDSQNRLWVGQESGLSIMDQKTKSFNRVPNFLFRQYDTELISFLRKMRENRTPLLQLIEVGDFADLSKEFVLSEDSYILISSLGEGAAQYGMVDFGLLQTTDDTTIWSTTKLYDTFHAGGHDKNRQRIGIMPLQKGRYKLNYHSDDSHSAQSYNRVPPQDSLYWGIEIYTLSDSEYEKYDAILKNDINNSYMKGSVILSVFESSDKLIWVGTLDGLSIIDPSSLTVKNISTDTDELTISHNFVESICEDRFGNIWIATRDGLNKFDRSKNKIIIYREKEGLPSSNLRALELDDDGNLWVSSIKGISKVEIQDSSKTPIFINYDVRDGLQGYTFIGNASMKDEEGKLYFAGLDGFNSFLPGVTDKSQPEIVITNLSVSNKSAEELYDNLLGTKDLNEIEELSLAYNQNDITFEFASIHYARPDKNRLQYMLDGADEHWLEGSKQIASYTNLDPGDYVFKLRGSNGDGFWTDAPKEIMISITPAWWNNLYAYIGYGIIFFGLLYGVRRFEIERRTRINQFKQSKLRAEAAELKAKAAEAEKRVLETEFNQKKRELEEARQLQLSMLPKQLPQLPNLDIAVYMKTATEVGGDYYDFHVGFDGTLTVVLGDATGHGMKAGTMVTSVKSLFNVLAPNPDIVMTFHEITRCLKLMQMEKLSMCMSMLKISGNKVQMSAAGMPPTFIYNSGDRTIEEYVIKGMPLGTMSKFPYDVKETTLKAGDTILMMSDGFPELINGKGELYGYKRARNRFEEAAEETPEEIIDILKNDGSEWIGGKDPDDDVTFVVIKVK